MWRFSTSSIFIFPRTDQTNARFHRSPTQTVIRWYIFMNYLQAEKISSRECEIGYTIFFTMNHIDTHTHRSLHGTMRPSREFQRAQSEWSERTVPVPCMFDYVCMLDANMEQTLNKRVLSHALTFYSGSYSFLAVHRVYFALVPFHFQERKTVSQPASQSNHCQEILAQVWD